MYSQISWNLGFQEVSHTLVSCKAKWLEIWVSIAAAKVATMEVV
jgi:hypothetical protein